MLKYSKQKEGTTHTQKKKSFLGAVLGFDHHNSRNQSGISIPNCKIYLAPEWDAGSLPTHLPE